MMCQLQFSENMIKELAARYRVHPKETEIENISWPTIRKQKALTRENFLLITTWKSARPTPRYHENSEAIIREITQAVYNTSNEQLRLEYLTLLKGVRYGVASALLHFMFNDRYPIIDFRALRSAGFHEANSSSFYDGRIDLWFKYASFCRDLAQRNKVSMRTLDRALWQYDDELNGRK